VAAIQRQHGVGVHAYRTQTIVKPVNSSIRMILVMVEAAGVEPASEIAVSRESPCVVTFRRFRNVRSERTRYARR
jgi:hypothetical protein